MKHALIIMLLLTLGAATAEARVIEVWFSHADQQFYSDSAATIRWDRKVNEGDAIELNVIDTPVGIFELKLQRTNKPDNSLSAELAKKLGLPESALAVDTHENDQRNLAAAYASLVATAQEFNSVLAQPSRYENEYETKREAFRRDFSRVVTTAKLDLLSDAAAMTTALHTALGAGAPGKETVQKVVNLARALWGAGPLGGTRAATFDADQEFDVTMTWIAPEGSGVTAPGPQRLSVRFASNWVITSTVGFAGSRLVDQNYTTKTVEVTPASGTTAAVTKKVAVREQEDQGSLDATMFVHVTPTGDWWRDNWPKYIPRQVSFGVGIGTNASGRIYAGFSWPLGRSASISLGAAGGKTKVLSRNVNVDDLGAVDPQASRRDVFRFAPFIGFSWRVAGAANPK